MRCHHIQDEIAGKVLIPGCMAVTISQDIEDCTCSGHIKPSIGLEGLSNKGPRRPYKRLSSKELVAILEQFDNVPEDFMEWAKNIDNDK